jgi:hypothetical protein
MPHALLLDYAIASVALGKETTRDSARRERCPKCAGGSRTSPPDA